MGPCELTTPSPYWLAALNAFNTGDNLPCQTNGKDISSDATSADDWARRNRTGPHARRARLQRDGSSVELDRTWTSVEPDEGAKHPTSENRTSKASSSNNFMIDSTSTTYHQP